IEATSRYVEHRAVDGNSERGRAEILLRVPSGHMSNLRHAVDVLDEIARHHALVELGREQAIVGGIEVDAVQLLPVDHVELARGLPLLDALVLHHTDLRAHAGLRIDERCHRAVGRAEGAVLPLCVLVQLADEGIERPYGALRAYVVWRVARELDAREEPGG